MLIMVGLVLAQDLPQMVLIPDEGAVEKLAPASAGPAFGYCVHPGACTLQSTVRIPGIGEDHVGRGRVVRAAVADHELDPLCLLAEVITRLRACWAVHSPVGCSVTPGMRMRLVACSVTART